MLYLDKLLRGIKQNPQIFKTPEVILTLGLTATHIKELKKLALEKKLIIQSKNSYFLTPNGEDFLEKSRKHSNAAEKSLSKPNINVEYLKEEKTPAVLTKAIRLLAKHLVEKSPLKENSLEHALFEDVKLCEKLISKIGTDILIGNKVELESIYEKYLKTGASKSLISICLLKFLSDNLDKIAIYEKSQFQLKFDTLMFDRMVACPQNFELQKTVMADFYILKDVSKIILHEKNDNILDITKGLYSTFRNLDKYTMNTQNLDKKTLRLRSVIVNAKDPVSLFERDIPKALGNKNLAECDREFLDILNKSLSELKDCTKNLVKDIKNFILKSFQAKSKEDLANRFEQIKEFFNEKELKILLNSVMDTDVNDELWSCRIATFVNKSRVPKDWSDEDYADFKVKIAELALKFSVLESVVGSEDTPLSKKAQGILDKFLILPKSEQTLFLRKAIKK